MQKLMTRIQRLNRLITIKGTGTPAELAGKMKLSERSIFEYLRLMKEMGAPILYSRTKGTYYYSSDGEFTIAFVPSKEQTN